MSFGKNRVSLLLVVSLLVLTGFAFALPAVRAALGKASRQAQEALRNPLSAPKTRANSAPRLAAAAAPAAVTTDIVGWSSWFSSTTADQGITGNVGVSTLTTVGANAITVSDAYGLLQMWAFATGWDNGANTKAWRFSFSTTNYTTLKFSCRMAGTTAFTSFMGPRDFKLQYSLNGTTWTDVSGGSLQAGTATASVINFNNLTNVTLPAACENQPTVYLQMLMTSNIGANGSSSVNGGQSHIDDILVTGEAAPVLPTITSATYNASTGVLAVTAANMTTGDTIAVGNLTLTGEGGTTYTLTSANVTASSATAFSVTLNATDTAAVNQILNKNGTSSTGATTYNLAAATNWDSTASAAADLTGNGVTVSNVAVPTLTSATYDATSGVLVATGTGLLKLSGATNDIVANKLTFTGQGGATYTLTDSANVEITSGTAFSLTLSATDKTALNLLLNKNGTSSNDSTTYNLAAAEDWAAGASAAVVVADTTGNGITVSNVPVPAPTLGNYATTTVTVGGNTTVTPSAAATNATSATALAPGFTGLLFVNPATGVVSVNNAQPAGSYTVTVKAFGAGGSTTKTFTLTVNNPITCTIPGFSGSTEVGVGSAPYGVALGDVNGDGKLDFAAANYSSNTVSVRLGDGAGNFTGATEVNVGTNPYAVALGDVNGDGKLDVAAANYGDATVSIRLGNGDGTFSGTTEISVGSATRFVAMGDLNGDGKLDFVAGNFNVWQAVSVRLGNGDGSFSNAADVSTGLRPCSVALGDVNGDGKLDFATTNQHSDTVSIRQGNGDGTFSGATNLSVGTFPSSVVLGDINRDGKVDFAAANLLSQTISIRLGDGAGSFSGSTNVGVGLTPRSVVLGDVNGDGNLDLAAAGSSGTVSIRLGDGTGSFSGTTAVSVGSNPYSVALGDFNGDGKLDFATANSGSNSVSIRLNSCTNNTAPSITAGSALARAQGAAASNATIATVSDTETAVGSLTVTATTVPTGITITNISNSSGTITADVAAGCTATAGANTVVLTVTDGGSLTATANLTVNVASSAVSISTPPATQTVTAGGSVTFSVTASNAVSYQWRKGTTNINGATASSYTINPVSSGDAGSYDVVVTGACGNATSTAATLTVNTPPTLGNYATTTVTAGGNTTVTPTAAPTNTTSVTAIAPGFTGLLFVNPTTGVVSVNNAQPAGSYTVTVNAFGTGGSTTKTFTLTVNNPFTCTIPGFSGTTNVSVGNGSHSVALGDFNGDGKLDFATANNSVSNTVSVRLGDGAGGFSGTTEVSVGGNPYSVAVGDFNGDGKLDFATANNNNSTVSIRLGDGAGGFSGTTEVGVGLTPTSVAVGDFNGDGKLDFATANNSSNTVSIRLGDGAGGFTGTTNISVGTNPQSVTVGDFNGDGHLDFATADGGSNTVSIRLGDGTGAFTGTTNVSVGTSPLDVAAGDFNGDGHLDFATANHDSHDVSIRLGNGAGAFTGTTTVSAGSRPVSVALGDFNGDGKLDFAAANYSSNNVSIRLGDGAGAFTGTTTVSAGNGPSGVGLGDFNGDGKLDFAAVNYDGGTVSIRLNSCTNNTAPSITAGSALARTQGAAASNATIATVNDTETAAGSLTVTATTVPTGITITNIVNSGGTITADVAAGCTATAGANTVVLTVTDGGSLTATANLTVNVASSAVSISTPPATQTVTAGGSVTFSVTASNAVSYQWRKGTTNIPSATSSSYTINPVSTTDAGSYNVVVTGVCDSATSAAATLTVNQATQTITFGTLASKTWGDAAFTVSATASSSLPVSFSVASGPATISGNTVTLTGAGTVTIRAAQAGNTEYNAATNVDQSFTVNKATLTVTAADKTKVYGAANPTLTYSYGGFVNSETASVLTGTPSVTTAATTTSGFGSYAITAAVGTLTASNYQFSFVAGNLTISKATLTVTANSDSRAYGAANPPLTASYTGFVNGETASVLTGAPTLTTSAITTSGIGSYAITAAVGTLVASNYDFSFSNGTLTVNKATLTVTAADKTRLYGAANPTLTASYSGFVNSETASVLTGTPSVTTTATTTSGVGSYAITAAVGTLAASNYSFSFAPGTLTVNQAPLTVKTDDVAKAYGAALPAFTASFTGFVNGETAAVLGGALQFTTTATQQSAVGTYSVTPSGLTASNYALTFQAGTLNITTLMLTIKAEDKTKVYGAANPTFTVTYTGFLAGEDQTVLGGTLGFTTAATAGSDVGSYTITPRGLTSSNYAIQFANGALAVTKAPLAVTTTNQTRGYGQANPALTGVLSGIVNSDAITASWSCAAVPSSVIGNYAITPTLNDPQNRLSNYDVTLTPGLLVVTRAVLTVTAANASRNYGAANPTLSGQITGLQNGDAITASYATTATATTAVGTYSITASLNDPNGRSGNYDVQFVNGTLTIGKALLTVTADDLTKVYGNANPALTYQVGGFKNGETASLLTGAPSLTTTASSSSHVGNYPVSIVAGTLSTANYDLTFVAGKLTVTPAPLTVTAESFSRAYGTANPRLMVSFTGLVNGDTMNLTAGSVTLSTTAQPNSPVGSYPIVASGLTNPDYSVTYVSGLLTITSVAPALRLNASLTPSALGQVVTFTASAQATTPFGGMPGGAITFTVDGKSLSPFVLNAAGQASFTSATLGIGAHTITASYSGDNNYQASTKELAQEVSKAASFTTLTTSAKLISTGQRLTLTAKVRSSASQPQGDVEFFADGKSLGRVALTNGVASFTVPELTAGEHALQAVYLGDSTAASSSSTMTQQVTEDCVFLLSQKEVLVAPQGGRVVIELNTRGGCAWTVGGQPAWIDLWSPDLVNGQWVITMIVAPRTQLTARTAKIRIGDQDVTITQSRPMAAVQAATYDPQTLAGDAIASIFGTELASSVASATSQPLPTQLGGVRVKLRDQQGNEFWASLLYASPTQINFVVPAGVAEGEVVVTVVRDDIETSASKFVVETVAPGVFSADSSGGGLAAGQIQRVRPDGSQSFTGVAQYNSVSQGYDYQPIILNTSTSLTSDEVYLVLYGTGLRNRTSLQNVRVRIGNQDAQVVYAGAQPQFAGLDQINILIPQSLAGAGLVDVVLTIDGKASNTVKIFIQ